ncbi:MAG: hypothetical protein NWS56_04375, partial [Haliea sp.]|nr:hypothetical protein [Haliea sp.]
MSATGGLANANQFESVAKTLAGRSRAALEKQNIATASTVAGEKRLSVLLERLDMLRPPGIDQYISRGDT